MLNELAPILNMVRRAILDVFVQHDTPRSDPVRQEFKLQHDGADLKKSSLTIPTQRKGTTHDKK